MGKIRVTATMKIIVMLELLCQKDVVSHTCVILTLCRQWKWCFETVLSVEMVLQNCVVGRNGASKLCCPWKWCFKTVLSMEMVLQNCVVGGNGASKLC